jgi:hypothetical protein
VPKPMDDLGALGLRRAVLGRATTSMHGLFAWFRTRSRLDIMVIAVPMVASASSLVGWAGVSHVLTDHQAAPAIVVYTIGGAAWTLFGLGIPYLVPTLIRPDIDSSHVAVTLVGVLCVFSLAVVVISNAVLFVVSGSSVGPYCVGATYAVASCLANFQIQRARMRHGSVFDLLFAAFVNSPLLPLAWVLLAKTATPGSQIPALSILLSGCCVFFLVRIYPRRREFLRDADARHHAMTTSQISRLRHSVLLLPHLAAFSVIAQEMRILALLFASSALLVSIHFSVILLNVGSILIATLHGVLAVRVQMLPDRQFAEAARSVGRRYATLGAVAALIYIALGPPTTDLLLSSNTGLTLVDNIALGSTFVALTAYYSISNCALRETLTGTMSAVSCGTLFAVVGLAALIARHFDSATLVFTYVATIWALPFVLFAALRATGGVAGDRAAAVVSGGARINLAAVTICALAIIAISV